MKRHLAAALLLVLVLAAASAAQGPSWIFGPSTFSHDPATGLRVTQYLPETRSYARVDPTYLESGYRHMQAIVRDGDGSADRMHIVQTWGMGEAIRPYGEWEFPFRAGATPFGPWGNPQGPWTQPFDSWQNPYGLGKLPHPPWPHWEQPGPYGYGPNGPYGYSGPYGPSGPSGYGPAPTPYGSASPYPPGLHAPPPAPSPSPSPAP